MFNFLYVLVGLKSLMLVWGILGFVEYVAPSVGFGLQNAQFPPGMQFLHWLLISMTGAIFILGFLRRWKFTPFATVTMYATLATVCFVQTVDYMAFGGGTSRFFVMGLEFSSYIALSFFLLRSNGSRRRFGVFEHR